MVGLSQWKHGRLVDIADMFTATAFRLEPWLWRKDVPIRTCVRSAFRRGRYLHPQPWWHLWPCIAWNPTSSCPWSLWHGKQWLLMTALDGIDPSPARDMCRVGSMTHSVQCCKRKGEAQRRRTCCASCSVKSSNFLPTPLFGFHGRKVGSYL